VNGHLYLILRILISFSFHVFKILYAITFIKLYLLHKSENFPCLLQHPKKYKTFVIIFYEERQLLCRTKFIQILLPMTFIFTLTQKYASDFKLVVCDPIMYILEFTIKVPEQLELCRRTSTLFLFPVET